MKVAPPMQGSLPIAHFNCPQPLTFTAARPVYPLSLSVPPSKLTSTVVPEPASLLARHLLPLLQGGLPRDGLVSLPAAQCRAELRSICSMELFTLADAVLLAYRKQTLAILLLVLSLCRA